MYGEYKIPSKELIQRILWDTLSSLYTEDQVNDSLQFHLSTD